MNRLYRVQKLECDGVSVWLCNDCEKPKVSLCEFPQGPSGAEVLHLVLGKGASVASEVDSSEYEEVLHFIGSRGSYTREFLGKGQGFEDMS